MKNIIISVVTAIVISLVVIVFLRQAPTVINNQIPAGECPAGNTNPACLGSSGNQYNSLLQANVGLSLDGAMLRGTGRAFTRATTTVCSLITSNATSAPMTLFVDITQNSTTTNRIMYVATSTLANRYSTTSGTTIFTSPTIAGNSQTSFSIPFINGSTSQLGMATTSPPNTAYIVSFQGGTSIAGTSDRNELNGSCSLISNRLETNQ